MGERAEKDTRWVDGRLRRVRGDGTLGATCLHGVGLTAGLWCGACMDFDPRVLPEPPATADHTQERVSAEEAVALHRVLTFSHPSARFINVRTWALAVVTARLAALRAEHDEAVAALGRVEALLAPGSGLSRVAKDAIRAALHPAPSEQPVQGGDAGA